MRLGRSYEVHLVDSFRDEVPKTYEGLRADRGEIWVVKRGWGSGPVRQKGLSCLHLEPLVGGNEHGSRGGIVCEVKGDKG